EGVALLVAVAGIVGTGLALRRSQRDGDTLLSELEVTTLDLAHWRSETRRGAASARRVRRVVAARPLPHRHRPGDPGARAAARRPGRRGAGGDARRLRDPEDED